MDQNIIMEDKVRNYLHGLSESDNEINLSLAKLADRIGCSVATVHRTVRKLESENIITIKRSKAKNKPDTIVFLYDSDDIRPMVTELISKSDTISDLIKQMVNKLMSKQNEINELKKKLQVYESRVPVQEVKLDNDLTAVFYKT